MQIVPRILKYYETTEGRIPFREWQEKCEKHLLLVIDYRLARIRRGLLGDMKAVGSGVFELRIDVGPGYRIYFGQRYYVILILCAGDKRSQNKDIKRAKQYWHDHLRRDQ